MVVAQHVVKTAWQKFYSFFGFWTYISRDNLSSQKTLYWMFLPWGPFFYKLDLFSWQIDKSIATRASLARRQFNATGFEP